MTSASELGGDSKPRAARRIFGAALFVSSKVGIDKKSPLIVTLHGMGAGPTIMVSTGMMGLTPGGGNSSGKDTNALSEKDVMNVLDIVLKEYKIDEKRMYLMGHSMGGAGTLHLGAKYPDKWAAFIEASSQREL